MHKKNLLNESSSIRDAMTLIDQYSIQIALIVDTSDRLIGTVTDGDIRRALLRGKTTENNVRDAMNKKFIFIRDSNKTDCPKSIMQENSIRHLPVLDSRDKIVDLLLIDSLSKNSALPNNIVIMAGGQGKRLRPLTENCPKPMLEIDGKPMLEIIIEQLKSNGFQNFYISVNYLKEKIVNYFGDGKALGVNINYINEEKPLGTAGSLKLLKGKNKFPFIVMNGDVLTRINLRSLLHYHQSNKAIATVCAQHYSISVPFGIIELDGINLKSFKEKPSFNYLVNAGIYVLDPQVVQLIDEDEKLDMPDLLSRARQDGNKVCVFPMHEYWLDVGKPEALDKAQLDWPVDEERG